MTRDWSSISVVHQDFARSLKRPLVSYYDGERAEKAGEGQVGAGITTADCFGKITTAQGRNILVFINRTGLKLDNVPNLLGSQDCPLLLD